MGKLSSIEYTRFAETLMRERCRSLADVAGEFGVSREYARQTAEKLGLTPRWFLSRRRKEIHKECIEQRKQKCLQRFKEKHKSEWTAYANAKQRCSNPKNPKWKDYGGRGIQFLFKGFREFMGYIGPKPDSKLTLDRIENNGNYEPGNVQWATRSEQSKKGKRRIITKIQKSQGYPIAS